MFLSIKESNFNGKNWSEFSHLLTVRAEGADLLFPPQQPLQQDNISQYHCQVDRNSQCEKVYSFVEMSKCKQGPYQLPADVVELVL